MRITREHIAAGKAGESADCAIALAMREAIGNTEFSVEIWSGCVALDYRGFRIKELTLPATLTQFQQRFDAGHDVAPGEYLWSELEELTPMFRRAAQRVDEGFYV